MDNIIKKSKLEDLAYNYAKTKFNSIYGKTTELIKTNEILNIFSVGIGESESKTSLLSNMVAPDHNLLYCKESNFKQLKNQLINKYEKEYINDLFNKTKVEDLEENYKKQIEELETKLKKEQAQNGVKKFMGVEKNEAIDNHNENIKNAGLGFSEYMENPVFLENHNPNSSVKYDKLKGKWKDIIEENKKAGFTKRPINTGCRPNMVWFDEATPGGDETTTAFLKLEPNRSFWERLKYLFTNH